MTTDVINGVPRSLLESIERLCRLTLSVADGEQLRALLATAQPAADGEREQFEAYMRKAAPAADLDRVGARYVDLDTEYKFEVWKARAAQPAKAEGVAVPEGYTAVKTETLEWMLGERGEFVCPPSEYFRGKPTPYFWRKHLRAAMKTAAPVPPVRSEGGDV